MSGGALKKKTKKNMNHDHIKEVFLRNKSACGIVAVFMRYTNEDSNDEKNVIFEYFSEKEFGIRLSSYNLNHRSDLY